MRELKLVIGIFITGALLVVCANLLLPRSLPEESSQRLQVLLQAGMYAEADLVYQQLISKNPSDADLHYAYVQNHFSIAPDARDDQLILQTFTDLSREAHHGDLGWVGLGLVYTRQENFSLAFSALEQVQDTHQKYYNLALGQTYAGLQQMPLAERHYRREIVGQGAVAQAVSRLAAIYLEQGMSAELHSLLSDQELAPYVGLSAQRRLAFEEGDWRQYLMLTFIRPFSGFSLLAIGFAVLICLVWLVYFGVLNHLNHRSPYALFLLTGLGALAAPLTFILTDALQALWPGLSNQGRLWEFARNLIQIGFLEELVKILPVVVVLGLPALYRRLFRPHEKNNEVDPFSLLMYGSLSALGFASLENAGYFSRFGLGVVYPRFWYSTVMHMAMTSIVCYAWIWARHLRPERPWQFAALGMVAAVVVHGVYDFFLLNGNESRMILLSLALMLVMVREFHRYLQNALNHSPAAAGLAEAQRVNLFAWLSGVALALLALLYLYNYQTLATAIANASLSSLSLSALPPALVVLAALGRLNLHAGDTKPWGLRRKQVQRAGKKTCELRSGMPGDGSYPAQPIAKSPPAGCG
jgi:RsiW-degrading membrane proteinase PrsW (M82 family)